MPLAGFPAWKLGRLARKLPALHSNAAAGGRRITRRGLVFTAVILLLAVAAFVSANNLLFILLAAMLATLLVSGVVCRLSLAGLGLDFAIPEHVTARGQILARILLRNGKTWMPSFSIHLRGVPPSVFSEGVYFPVVPSGKLLEHTTEVTFTRRGLHRENTFLLVTQFPFGLVRREERVNLPREVLVYPAMEPHADLEELASSLAGEIEAHYRGSGHDFYRIRPYEPLESARYVDWKATAHTGSLQVREFAREQDPLVEMFLDLNVPEDHLPWFERALECCAYLAWRLTQREARVCFHTQEFDVALPAQGDVYSILRHLAVVQAVAGLPPAGPENARSFGVVFTVFPEQFKQAGWHAAHFITPETLPAEGAAAPFNSSHPTG